MLPASTLAKLALLTPSSKSASSPEPDPSLDEVHALMPRATAAGVVLTSWLVPGYIETRTVGVAVIKAELSIISLAAISPFAVLVGIVFAVGPEAVCNPSSKSASRPEPEPSFPAVHIKFPSAYNVVLLK